ncbi:MAG: prephenate dehydrogenase/arogenate dehydrogenase family protein [Deltaproteobacteria bacterium]|nr:prephenate dehydrogenase/arogenate dehydrogenase family protein [Deltaproteobacteria bacterium]
MAKPKWKKVVIVGVGLIGGSFAKAIRKKGLTEEIVGIGRTIENLKIAQHRGLIDRYTRDLKEGVQGADLVFVSVPVLTIPSLVERIESVLSPEAVITDAGSVKGPIVGRLSSRLRHPERFVGGHPIAGTEQSGAGAAFASLFKGKLCFLTPTPRTDRVVLEKIRRTWLAIGAKVQTIDPQEHDRIFACVSHLPHLVAYALVGTVLETDRSMLRYSGGGFRDFTRIAESPAEMWRDISLMNQKALLKALDRYEKVIGELSEMIQSGDSRRLLHFFQKAQKTKKGMKSL